MPTNPEFPEQSLIRIEVPSRISLPKRIFRLGELAYNLWWSWQPEAQALYRGIDPMLWDACNHNPVRFLLRVRRKQLNAVARGRRYLEEYDRVLAAFDDYMHRRDTWFSRNYAQHGGDVIAYFSTEFGLHESLPIYAGGLGVLSGDHAKSASDLGLPFVGVGFLYDQGYFRQRISEDGWQEAFYDEVNHDELPALPVLDEHGRPLCVAVELPGRQVWVRVWRVLVGRTLLLLMDSDLALNQPADRSLTGRLYSSDLEVRISQEIVLGIGGVRLLHALGIRPVVWHMNEGHSAFLVLERVRQMMAEGASFEATARAVRASTIFTTHTPVPAGNETFPTWLVEKYFAPYWGDLKLSAEEFLELARIDQPWGQAYSMPILALRHAGRRNAVSELHGQVSREMWQFLWPGRRAEETPITHVTNGVHLETWLARRLRLLYNRYLGPDWVERLDDPALWDEVLRIPDEDIWNVHRHLKRKLQAFMRDRAREMWTRHVHPVQVVTAGALLDHNTLTVGFARRFATYKRASLLLRDVERLLDIVHRPGMPVQFIFAGKAHPADEPGKHLIQGLYRQIKRAEWAGRLVFLEDYDANIARHLVQGVDVWLNTPRRPHEASGTSGMKAAVNGVLNLSVLDGWWREGYNGRNGWAIGEDADHTDPDEQDASDAESLYSLLENEVAPLFYDREGNGVPHNWMRMAKESIRTLTPMFTTRRMVKEYIEQMYIPAAREARGANGADAGGD